MILVAALTQRCLWECYNKALQWFLKDLREFYKHQGTKSLGAPRVQYKPAGITRAGSANSSFICFAERETEAPGELSQPSLICMPDVRQLICMKK